MKRLAASFEVCGRELGFSRPDRRDVVIAAVAAYRTVMRRAATMRALDVWYDHIDGRGDPGRDRRRGPAEAPRQGRGERGGGRPRQGADPRPPACLREAGRRCRRRAAVRRRPTADRAGRRSCSAGGIERDELDAWIGSLVSTYRRLARARAPPARGVPPRRHRPEGGRGRERRHACLDPPPRRPRRERPADPAVEGGATVGAGALPAQTSTLREPRPAGGRRPAPDAGGDRHLPRLVASHGPRRAARDYYIRQLHDWKGCVEPETFRVRARRSTRELCGATLARAHARWGDRIAIASYLGKGDASTGRSLDFAAAYADQNERDYEAFADAVRTGRIEAETTLSHRSLATVLPGLVALHDRHGRNGSLTLRNLRGRRRTAEYTAWCPTGPSCSCSPSPRRSGRRRSSSTSSPFRLPHPIRILAAFLAGGLLTTVADRGPDRLRRAGHRPGLRTRARRSDPIALPLAAAGPALAAAYAVNRPRRSRPRAAAGRAIRRRARRRRRRGGRLRRRRRAQRDPRASSRSSASRTDRRAGRPRRGEGGDHRGVLRDHVRLHRGADRSPTRSRPHGRRQTISRFNDWLDRNMALVGVAVLAGAGVYLLAHGLVLLV